MEGFFKDTSMANCGRFNDESIIFHGSFITTFKKLHGLKTLGFLYKYKKILHANLDMHERSEMYNNQHLPIVIVLLKNFDP